jgi:hypothetical protein
MTYLIQRLAILVQTRVYGFEVFLSCIQSLLEGILQLCKHQRCLRGVCHRLVSHMSLGHAIGKPTGCDLLSSCSEHVDRLLHIVDAGREVCAALEELYLLTEVVHGRSDSYSPQLAAM